MINHKILLLVILAHLAGPGCGSKNGEDSVHRSVGGRSEPFGWPPHLHQNPNIEGLECPYEFRTDGKKIGENDEAHGKDLEKDAEVRARSGRITKEKQAYRLYRRGHSPSNF